MWVELALFLIHMYMQFHILYCLMFLVSALNSSLEASADREGEVTTATKEGEVATRYSVHHKAGPWRDKLAMNCG